MTKEKQKHFKNIILTGMPGSGKSSFGKIYALYSGRYFLDFDKYFEIVTKKKAFDIFKTEGEESFRSLEKNILKKLEKKHNYVIAMGGGTLCTEENFEFARRLGLIVYLETPLEVIAKRIYSDQTNKLHIRPLFADFNSLATVQNKVNELWQKRKDFYEKAYIHLNTEFSSLDNLKLQLGLYEKKSAQREHYKEKNTVKPHKSFYKNTPAH